MLFLCDPALAFCGREFRATTAGRELGAVNNGVAAAVVIAGLRVGVTTTPFWNTPRLSKIITGTGVRSIAAGGPFL